MILGLCTSQCTVLQCHTATEASRAECMPSIAYPGAAIRQQVAVLCNDNINQLLQSEERHLGTYPGQRTQLVDRLRHVPVKVVSELLCCFLYVPTFLQYE